MKEQIKSEFEKNGFSLEDEEEILQKCLSFCVTFKLTASDLISSWEVYYLNRQLNGSTIHIAQMDGFLLHLQNEQQETLNKEEQQHPYIYSNNDIDMIPSDEIEDVKDSVLVTPTKQSETPSSHLTPETNGYMPSSGRPSRLANNHVTPFGQRSSKFTVQVAFNKIDDLQNNVKDQELVNDEDDVIRRVQPIERCSFEVQGLQPEPGCRFMYDRIEDKFNFLEERIRRHATGFVASGLYEEPADPTVASQNSIFSVGMVCCDGEGHLNEKSVLLQGSVEHSGGQRVRLDMSNVSQYSLFPGQVVGIGGNNPSGHCLIATKVVDSIPLTVTPDLDLPPPKKQAMDQEYRSTSSSTAAELSMVIAAGPFSTTDNLLFEPLTELLSYARRKQPQLLMLLGPFVDSEHPEVKTGVVDRSYTDIFHTEIMRRLQDYTEYMGPSARVILVPSIRDASHDFVFPQPAFDLHSYDLKHQISTLPNPGFFHANEVKVACCTVDILKQLSGEEISRIPAGGSRDRMARLATHVLSQRSFYPLYPPSEDVPLDLSLAPKALQISSMPDVLVLPSDLTPFVKVLSAGAIGGDQQVKCIAVNPGRLAKGVGGGTFVELNYHGDPDRTNASVIRI